MAKKKAEHGARSQAIRDYLANNPKASPNDVVAALKEKGIEVSVNLVSNIKYRKAKQRIRRSTKVNGKDAVAGPSRSQSIREYLAQNRNATPKEIVAGLKEQGTEVSVGLASLIKYKKASGQTGRSLRRAARGGALRKSSGITSAADILEAKKLADAMGGVANAKRVLELLEQLR